MSWGPHGETVYEPGDRIERMPTEYVAWMLEQGLIAPWDDDAPDHEEEADGPDVPAR
jgi:hypothetical protein